MTLKASVKKTDIFYFFIHFLLLLIFFVCLDIVSEKKEYCTQYFGTFSLLSFICMVTLVFINIKRTYKILSPMNLLVILSFLYHCGQVWLLSVGITVKRNSFTIDRYSDSSIIITLLIFQIFIIMLNLGSFFVKHKELETNNKITITQSISTDNCFYIGVVIFAISSLFLIYNDMQQIMASLSLGTDNYSSVYKIGHDNVLIYTSIYLFPIGVFLSMISAPSKKIEAFFAIFSCSRSILLMLIVGSRSAYIPMLLCIAIYYLMKNNNKSVSQKYIIVIVLLVVVYSYVSYSRNSSDKFEVQNMFEYMLNNNIITDVLQELGSTQDDIILIYDNTPDNLPFANGKSFIGAIITLVPGLRNVFSQFNEYTDIGVICNTLFHKGASLGGSYFAELYYNFCGFSILLAPVFGFFFAKIDLKCRTISKSKDYFGIVVALYLFYTLMIYIRSSFVDVVYAIKLLLLVGIICFVFKKKQYQ